MKEKRITMAELIRRMNSDKVQNPSRYQSGALPKITPRKPGEPIVFR